MPMSEQTKRILLDTLKLNQLSDIAHRPFRDLPENVAHSELSAYATKGRGSIRLATGRFFTPEEAKTWAEKVRKMALP